jgi:hypothetical protein
MLGGDDCLRELGVAISDAMRLPFDVSIPLR